MSEQAAQAFIARMKTDEVFRDKAMAVDDTAARMELIRAEGFDCTADEIEAEGTRLDHDALRRVSAAGNMPLCDCPQATPRYASWPE